MCSRASPLLIGQYDRALRCKGERFRSFNLHPIVMHMLNLNRVLYLTRFALQRGRAGGGGAHTSTMKSPTFDSRRIVITRGFMDVTLDMTASEIWRLSASWAASKKSQTMKNDLNPPELRQVLRQVDVDTVIAALNLNLVYDPDSSGIIHNRWLRHLWC